MTKPKHPTVPAGPAAPRKSASRPVLPRLALLLVLGVVDYLWWVRHLGSGLSAWPWLAGLAAAVTAVAGWVEKLAEEDEIKEWKKRVRSALRRGLSWPVIAVLGLASIAFMLTFSSVMVLTEEGKAAKGVEVILASGGRPSKRGDPERFVFFTGPLGRTVEVKIPGYPPMRRTVPVIRGLRIDLGELKLAPTLLLRPSRPLMRALTLSGSRLDVKVLRGGAWIPFASFECPCQEASFQLGEPRPASPALLQRWERELRANGFESGQVEQVLLAWEHPQSLQNGPSPVPGMKMVAEVRSQASSLLASTLPFDIEEDFVDVAIRPQ